jgi:2'-5' RNA ligase
MDVDAMDADGPDVSVAPAHRLFFALWPDPLVRDAIARVASRLDASHAPDGRRQAPERYHVTLQFLGDVGRQPVDATRAALEAGTDVRAPGFELSLDRTGCFSRSHVWWLGSQDPPDALFALHRQLALALASRGLVLESGEYTPHVTLRRNIRRSLAATPIGPIAWSVRDFVLVDSRPGTPDPYRVLARWPLVDA